MLYMESFCANQLEVFKISSLQTIHNYKTPFDYLLTFRET